MTFDSHPPPPRHLCKPIRNGILKPEAKPTKLVIKLHGKFQVASGKLSFNIKHKKKKFTKVLTAPIQKVRFGFPKQLNKLEKP
jgi:hypothetical protein